MDDIDFEVNSFRLNSTYIQEPAGGKTIEIKKQHSFNQYIYKRYPFLMGLDMNRLVIAGGLCRSILLR
jgi:hypothetical protein